MNMSKLKKTMMIMGLCVCMVFFAPANSFAEGNSQNNQTSQNNGQTGQDDNQTEQADKSEQTTQQNQEQKNQEEKAQGKWVSSGSGWWYDNGDGTYAQNEYIDGYWLDSNGWYSAAWYGSWKSNSKGWWFESGSWYPKSKWLKIDHKWYYFGSDGYMRAGEWILLDGAYYYLTESGALATSTVVDGCEVDENGRWINNTPVGDLLKNTKTAEKTTQIITVINHELTLWEKQSDGSWKAGDTMYCGYGKNGFVLPEERSWGSNTTPKGSFELTYAFGKAENPGTEMTYRNITPYSYLSSEEATYNTWVESETYVVGEHLIDYYQYKYAVNIGFNINPTVYKRGAGIFLHCKSYDHWYTAGCVSLEEENMVSILKQLKNGAYMIIVEEKSEISNY